MQTLGRQIENYIRLTTLKWPWPETSDLQTEDKVEGKVNLFMEGSIPAQKSTNFLSSFK